MSKQEFLDALKKKLSGQPKQDVEERLNFYSEMIDDRIEEGLSEQEAVYQIGSVDQIAAQIMADIPLIKNAREKNKPTKRLRTWEIVLLLLGSPIWLSLAVAAFAVILSLYAVLLSVIASLWAVFASLVACALGVVMIGVAFAMNGNVFTGIAMVGAGIVCAGLAIFLFFGCMAATKGTLLLAKKIALGIIKCFVKKEES